MLPCIRVSRIVSVYSCSYKAKCIIREAPIVSFHLTRCSFVMMALVHFKCMASSCENSTLCTTNTVPSSTTVSWNGLYKPLHLHKGERRVKLQSLLLFYIVISLYAFSV